MKDLELKLDGALPVTREELIELISSWGRYKHPFFDKSLIEDQKPLSKLDVSQIVDFSRVFAHSKFNGDVSNWDTRSAKNFSFMFYNAKKFNSNIEGWNTENVEKTTFMFCRASEFNMPLDKWNVSKVNDMIGMFQEAIRFNQDLNSWNVSKVCSMASMFIDAKVFNGDVSEWDISSVTSVGQMFYNAKKFNKDISGWDTSRVTDATRFLCYASTFKHSLHTWNIEDFQESELMFHEATSFIEKFNNSEEIPKMTSGIKDWFAKNKEKMFSLNLSEQEKNEIDNFFNNLKERELEHNSY